MVEGGIFTILDNALKELNEFAEVNSVEIIALVNNKNFFNYPNIEFLEFPKSKKSWFYRLYYEYFFFKKLSLQLKPDIWISLHDITPNVIVKKQFVYLHHPTTLFTPSLTDWYFNPKIGLFHLFYDWLFQININKNHTVFVQQQWIKSIFEKRFSINTIKIASPTFVEKYLDINSDILLDSTKFHFFFPSYPRSFKNHELIIEALEYLTEETRKKIKIHFTTIKNNPDKYATFLYKNFKHLDEIEFHGILKRPEVLFLFKNTDALLFPSKVETWGLPISEAKAFNKPMLLANLPYAKEAVGNYQKVSFFALNSPDELAKLITKMVNNEIIFEGNLFHYDTQNTITNWKALFNYIINC